MTRPRSKGKKKVASRANRKANSTSAKSEPRHNERLGQWLAGVLAAVIATTSLWWAPALIKGVKGFFSSGSSGPALTVTAEPTYLDDQGHSTATPDGSRLSSQVLHLMTRPFAASSHAFLSAVQAMGGTDVDDLSVQLIVNGKARKGYGLSGFDWCACTGRSR